MPCIFDAGYIDLTKGFSIDETVDALKTLMAEPQAQFIANTFEVANVMNNIDEMARFLIPQCGVA